MAPAAPVEKMELRKERVGALPLVAAPTAHAYPRYHLEAFGNASAAYLRKRAIRQPNMHADRPDEIAPGHPEGGVRLRRPRLFQPSGRPAARARVCRSGAICPGPGVQRSAAFGTSITFLRLPVSNCRLVVR